MGMIFIADFIIKGLANIFISFLDKVAYALLYAGYTIFLGVSDLSLFGGEVEKALGLYNGFTQRVYTILSIAMVFFFSYQLLLMIANPDGDGAKSSTKIVKNAVISLVAIAVLPTVFNYLAVFQHHVIANNTITTLVLGSGGGNAKNPGRNLSMIVFMSMYHPVNTDYNTFFSNDGVLKVSGEAIPACTSAGASDTVCTEWWNGLNEWYHEDKGVISQITSREKLRNAVGDDDGTEYNFILSTAAAVACAWFFLSYALDLGTRAVKLGFLEIIAPIPLVMKIFPQTKKSYDTWFKEITSTYLEVFLRVLVISFIIELCVLVPDFIDILFGANSTVASTAMTSAGSTFVKCIASVILILGLLNFAKDAPGLVKSMFATGGLFDNINLKPGVKKRIQDNEYAMRAGGAATGFLGGAAVNGWRKAKNTFDNSVKNDGDTLRGIRKGIGSGLLGVIGGGYTGIKTGWKNSLSDPGFDGMLAGFTSGGEAAKIASAKREAAMNKSKVPTTIGKYIATSAAAKTVKSNAESLAAVGRSFTTGAGVTVNDETKTFLDNLNNLLKNTADAVDSKDRVKVWKEAKSEAMKNAAMGEEVTIERNGVVVKTKDTEEIQKYYDGKIDNAKTEELKKPVMTANAKANIGAVAQLMAQNQSKISSELMTEMRTKLDKIGDKTLLKKDNNGNTDVLATLNNISRANITDANANDLRLALGVQGAIKDQIKAFDAKANIASVTTQVNKEKKEEAKK